MEKFIKTGSSRKVFLIGKYAIKIPNFYSHKTFLNGCRDNWSERIFYRDFKGVYCDTEYLGKPRRRDLTELVVPSLFCSWFGFIQVQLRVVELERDLTSYEVDRFQGVCKDIHRSNFGILKGRILCFDYAS